MSQEMLRLNVTALNEPHLSALDELWAEMGRAEMGRERNWSTTATPPAWPLRWPVYHHKQEKPDHSTKQ